MPRKQNKSFVTPPPEELEVQNPEELPELTAAEVAEAQEEQDDVDEIYETCESLDLKGGHVKMFLRRPGETEQSYVGKMPIDTFRMDGLDTLAAGPGGGDYLFKFCDSNGKIVKQRSLRIDSRFKGNLGAVEAPAPAKPDAEDRIVQLVEKLKPAPADQNMMPLMITLITESQKTMVTLMAENQKSTNTILTGLMAAISQSAAKPATDPLLLEMIRTKTDKTPLLETIEAMVALRSLQEGEAPSKPDMVEKLITTMGPTLINILARQQQQSQPMPSTVAVEAPRAIASEAPAASGAAGANGAPGPEPKLATFIPMLLNAARKGTPPAAYYEVICDNIPEDQLDKLIDELETPGWFESLFGTHPEVLAQKAWLEKLRQVFLDADAEGEEAAAAKEAKA